MSKKTILLDIRQNNHILTTNSMGYLNVSHSLKWCEGEKKAKAHDDHISKRLLATHFVCVYSQSTGNVYNKDPGNPLSWWTRRQLCNNCSRTFTIARPLCSPITQLWLARVPLTFISRELTDLHLYSSLNDADNESRGTQTHLRTVVVNLFWIAHQIIKLSYYTKLINFYGVFN